MSYYKKEIFVDECYKSLISDLVSFGNHISVDEGFSLKALIETFYDGISGNISSKFYLNSLPPGTGKTQAISCFIKAWKANGFLPAGGILIGLKTKAEIKALVKRLELDPADFACLTRDDGINALGCGDIDNAPVLITTQRMIINRTKDRSFGKATAFHYQGTPRALRIWDESFVLAESITLGQYDLATLPSALAKRFTYLAAWIDRLTGTLRDAAPGVTISIPKSLAEEISPVWTVIRAKHIFLTAIARRALEALETAAGRKLIVRDAGGMTGRVLVGASRPIPDDFAPAIITDASGTVRATYKLMEEARDNLLRLPSSITDYRNVRIHLIERASGKATLKDETQGWGVFRKVAEDMHPAPEPWLVVSYKPDGELDVKAAVAEATDKKVDFDFLHWGIHHGTNMYRHVKNVAIIGPYYYARTGYEALGIAATGLPIDEVPPIDIVAMQKAEFQHNMLQAMLRGNARNSVNGIAGECNVLIVASPNLGADKLLAATFPNAKITVSVAPKASVPSKYERPFIEALGSLLPPGKASVSKRAVSKAAGIPSTTELTRQIKRPAVQAYLEKERILVAHHAFKREL